MEITKIPVLLSLSNLTLLLTYLFWSAYFSHTAFVFCLFFLLLTPFCYTAYYFSLFLCISLCLFLFLPAIHLSSVFLFLLFGPPLFIVCACSVIQLCPILYDLTDCNLPGSSVSGIFQARILEWVAISFSRGSS